MIGHVEAEAAFLGCLLQGSPMLTKGFSAQVEAADFTDPKHRAVLAAIWALVDAHQPVDPITVLGEMRRSGLESSMTADRSAGVFLADVFACVPVPASAGAYLRVILEHRLRREVERIGVKFQQAAESCPLDELRDLARGEITELGRIFGRVTQRESAEVELVSAR